MNLGLKRRAREHLRAIVVVVRVERAAQPEDRAVADVAQAHHLLARGRVRGVHCDHQRDLVQPGALEAVQRRVHADEREVELAPLEACHERTRFRDLHAQAHLAAERRSPRRLELPVRSHRDGHRHADAHERRLAPRLELRPEGLDVGEDAARALERRLARGGEPHGARVALEEAQSQACLELADLAAQGRLRDVQALGGAPETELLGNGDEVAQLAQVECGFHT
jgi:hypothetical protein